MKKLFLLVPVAALAMTACTNESTESVGAAQQSQEIAISPLAQSVTRAAITDGVFPTSETMDVAAYDATAGRNFFASTTFSYNYANGAAASSGHWGGNPARYWPLSAAYINFLAYANVTGSASFDGTTPASAATVSMTDNSSAQKDLVYAIGQGEVTQAGNTLTFPTKVDMAFQHAQSLIEFRVKAADDASEAVHIDKITLNNAYYSGTFTITHTGYAATSSQTVDGVWSDPGTKKNLDVPGSSDKSIADDAWTNAGSVLVVPNPTQTTPPTVDPSFDSFTITYTLDSKQYTYTYQPTVPTGRALVKATKYVYDITFKVHEIFIDATVASWTDGGTDAITIFP